MKNEEILHHFEEVNKRIDTLGDLTEKTNILNKQMASSTQSAKTIDETKQNVEIIKTTIETAQNEINTIKNSVSTDAQTIKEYIPAIEQQKTDYSTSKKQFDNLLIATQNLLGLVNAEKLANSFKSEADKLEKEIKMWFSRYFYSIVGLFLATIGIIIWEILAGGQFLTAGFAIKLSITAPIVYITIFIHGQFNKTKELYDQYIFKASVARSFEVYRQIFKEDGTNQDNKIESKVLDFFINTVIDIYKSPCKPYENIISEKQAEGILERFATLFTKYFK